MLSRVFAVFLQVATVYATHVLEDDAVMSVRIMDNTTGVITIANITGVPGDVPAISGTALLDASDVTCAKRVEGSTTILPSNTTRPANDTFRGLYVMECTVSKTGFDIIIVPPDGGGNDGNSVLVETTGACAEIAYADLPQPSTVSATGEFNYTTAMPTDGCSDGRRTTELVPTTATVKFTVGLLDTRLTGNGNRLIKTVAQAPGLQTYNLGVDSPHHEYFAGACDMCFGAVEVDWLTSNGVRVNTQRYAGFTPPTYLATVPVQLDMNAKSPAPTVFRTVLGTDLYNFVASSTTKEVALLSGLIKCGTVNVSAALYDAGDLTAISNECRKSLATQYGVTCPTGAAATKSGDTVNGTVTAEGQTFNIMWDISILGQYSAVPTNTYTTTVVVPFTSFEKRLLVEWDDGYKAIVQNSLTLDALNLDGATTTTTANSVSLYREECDLQSMTVARNVVFKSAAEYSLGPRVQMLPTMRFQKYSLQNATVGMTATGVQFCSSDDDGTADCVDTRRDGDDHIYMTNFEGCKGAAATDVGGMVTFSDTSNTTYLASQIECSGSSRVEIANLYLNWELTFKADAFDNTNEITDTGAASTLTGFTPVFGVAMHSADLCSGDGSVTVPAAPWNATICGAYLPATTFANLKQRFTDCGVENTMFLTQYVTFTNAASGEVLKFCNAKKLTYAEGVQEGVITASFAVASRTGYEAAVSLVNFEWETCETDNYRQVMTLSMTHNYDGNGALSLDMTTNDILQYDTSASNLNTGLVKLKSACTDICVDQAQLDQTATTQFTIRMGGGTYTSDFQMVSKMEGNPCDVTDELAAIPGMQLRIEKKASTETCTAFAGLASLVEESVFDSGDLACFHLSLAPGQSKNAAARLNIIEWDVVAADGLTRSFVVNGTSLLVDDWYAHNEYLVSTTDFGADIHVHVYYRQDHSARRRLRATYVLGSRDVGDTGASFTVLPAHIAIADNLDGLAANTTNNGAIPADDDLDENWFGATIWAAIGGAALFIIIGIIVYMCRGHTCNIKDFRMPVATDVTPVDNKNPEWKYSRVGRFNSKLKY